MIELQQLLRERQTVKEKPLRHSRLVNNAFCGGPNDKPKQISKLRNCSQIQIVNGKTTEPEKISKLLNCPQRGTDRGDASTALIMAVAAATVLPAAAAVALTNYWLWQWRRRWRQHSIDGFNAGMSLAPTNMASAGGSQRYE